MKKYTSKEKVEIGVTALYDTFFGVELGLRLKEYGYHVIEVEKLVTLKEYSDIVDYVVHQRASE